MGGGAALAEVAAGGGVVMNANAAAGNAAAGNEHFNDSIEAWEKNAINGRGPGPVISLREVKKNNALRFKLHQKWVGMHLLDKNPEAANANEPGLSDEGSAGSRARSHRDRVGVLRPNL